MELDKEFEEFDNNGVGDNDLVPDLDCSPLTPMKNRATVEPPVVGMIFETVVEAGEYYRAYGRCEGFDVRIRSTAQTEKGSDRITSSLFVCSCEGKHEKVSEVDKEKRRNTSTGRCGCKASMRVKWTQAGFYQVRSVVLEHSHLPVTPSKFIKMKANRHFPDAAKGLAKRFGEEGLPISKVATVFGGNEIGFSKKDCQNHFRATKKNPKEGDATDVLNYFQRKHAQDENFFYNIQYDDENRAINFFWIDGRSKMQYELFGDVVVFDTTYKTNSYSMPFAPFTGVNHHLQNIQFGCALLLDETESTFVWLFKTWLTAMKGRHPVSILTDLDRAMTAAVAQVFPDTRHRFCVWHITKKIPEKFCHVIKKNADFHDELNLIIYCSYRIEDFEKAWEAHFLKYDLLDHDWVKELFAIRSKWVPAFFLNTFYAGMHTTGRGESMNSTYDAFVNHNTNLIDFVEGSDRCNAAIVFQENEYDYRSEHRTPIVSDTGAYLLKYASKVYTKKVFLEFKNEWGAAMKTYIIASEEVQGDGYTTYTLRSRNLENPNYWKVFFSIGTQEGNCECKYFEFMGLPCGHILKVFMRHDIDDIPKHFILGRWRIRANSYHSMFHDDGTSRVGSDNLGALQQTILNRVANEFAAHCSHPDDYDFAMERFKGLFLEVDERIEERRVQSEDTHPDAVTEDASPNTDQTQILLLNPHLSQTKGRGKQAVRYKRGNGPTKVSRTIGEAQSNMVGESEEAPGRGCRPCKDNGREFVGHDWRICKYNPNSKVHMAEKTQEVEESQEIEESQEDEESQGPKKKKRKKGCTRCRLALKEYKGHDWRNCIYNPGAKKNKFQP